MRMLLPVGRSGWAIAAGYLGLFGLVVFPAPLALVVSIIAIRDIRKSKGSANPKHGMGRAVFGLVVGIAGTAILLLAAVSAVARLVVYLSACGATLRLRRADMATRVAPANFTVPLGPVIPVIAILISSSILAGATAQQLLSGVAALAVGGVLYAIATRGAAPRPAA